MSARSFNPTDSPVPYGNVKLSQGPDLRVPDNAASISAPDQTGRNRRGRFVKLRADLKPIDQTPRIKGKPDTQQRVERAWIALERAVEELPDTRSQAYRASLVRQLDSLRSIGPKQAATVMLWIETGYGTSKMRRLVRRAKA
tara:strand:- start:8045 stop:8470 length:426 start_codon:yes stop_codon:yes gene_type:complete